MAHRRVPHKLVYSPYTRKSKPDRDDRPLFDETDKPFEPKTPPPCSSRALLEWSTSNIRLSDDETMSSLVDLDELGQAQRLVFRNLKLGHGSTEISTLLDVEVFDRLPCGRWAAPQKPLIDAVEFRPTESRGYGCFATQFIPQASLIHVEYPATVTQNTMVLPPSYQMTTAEVYRELFRRVPDKTFQALMSLCNSQPPESGFEPEEAILRTNAIGITLPSPESHGSAAMGHNAVFLQASRFNHSCAPNASHRFDPKSFTLTVHTLRPINKGEEICISYIDLIAHPTRAARLSMLEKLHHFHCTCAVCMLPAAVITASDARRERISEATPEKIHEPFNAWYASKERSRDKLEEVMAFHTEAVVDMMSEGLHFRFRYFLHLFLLAVCYAALKDTRNFRSWLGKARDVANSSYLASEETQKLLQHIMNPETLRRVGIA
uniref:SET domain-containing protein n=1 Tax=Mycena chlorophos TaxID=658473 RepID=A0ABQ0L0E8_MYCCL|nr:predicted protein [Mycena chlorophos]